MEVFPIIPAAPRVMWIVLGVCALVIAILAALAFTAWASGHSRVELGRDRIRLAGDFWGREIALQDLDLEGARVLDLAHSPDLAPRWRTFGTGLPGYSSGWFRLRNGEKALVYLTRRSRVAYVPTRKGYTLLLSVEQPRRFIDALKARTGDSGSAR